MKTFCKFFEALFSIFPFWLPRVLYKLAKQHVLLHKMVFICLFILQALSCAKTCNSAEDCGDGQCCVAKLALQFPGKGVCANMNTKSINLRGIFF